MDVGDEIGINPRQRGDGGRRENMDSMDGRGALCPAILDQELDRKLGLVRGDVVRARM